MRPDTQNLIKTADSDALLDIASLSKSCWLKMAAKKELSRRHHEEQSLSPGQVFLFNAIHNPRSIISGHFNHASVNATTMMGNNVLILMANNNKLSSQCLTRAFAIVTSIPFMKIFKQNTHGNTVLDTILQHKHRSLWNILLKTRKWNVMKLVRTRKYAHAPFVLSFKKGQTKNNKLSKRLLALKRRMLRIGSS